MCLRSLHILLCLVVVGLASTTIIEYSDEVFDYSMSGSSNEFDIFENQNEKSSEEEVGTPMDSSSTDSNLEIDRTNVKEVNIERVDNMTVSPLYKNDLFNSPEAKAYNEKLLQFVKSLLSDEMNTNMGFPYISESLEEHNTSSQDHETSSNEPNLEREQNNVIEYTTPVQNVISESYEDYEENLDSQEYITEDIGEPNRENDQTSDVNYDKKEIDTERDENVSVNQQLETYFTEISNEFELLDKSEFSKGLQYTSESSEEHNHASQENSFNDKNLERNQTNTEEEVDTTQVVNMSVDQLIETLFSELEMELLDTSESSQEKNHSQQEYINEDEDVDDDVDEVVNEDSSEELSLESIEQTNAVNDDKEEIDATHVVKMNVNQLFATILSGINKEMDTSESSEHNNSSQDNEDSLKDQDLESDQTNAEADDMSADQLIAKLLSEINEEIELLDTSSESSEDKSHSQHEDVSEDSATEQNLERAETNVVKEDVATLVKSMNVHQLFATIFSGIKKEIELLDTSALSGEHTKEQTLETDQISAVEDNKEDVNVFKLVGVAVVPTNQSVDDDHSLIFLLNNLLRNIYVDDDGKVDETATEIPEEITEKMNEDSSEPEVNIIEQYYWNDVTIVDKINIALSIFLIVCFIIIIIQIVRIVKLSKLTNKYNTLGSLV